jgi:hypothetical protein
MLELLPFTLSLSKGMCGSTRAFSPERSRRVTTNSLEILALVKHDKVKVIWTKLFYGIDGIEIQGILKIDKEKEYLKGGKF